MSFPRFRLRTLMIAVAVAAVVIGIPLYWANWLGRTKTIPIDIGVHADLRPVRGTCIAGQTVPVEIEYNVELGSPKPPAGMFLRFRIDTKVEERATGAIVDQYTFHRHLASGVREKSSGTIPWQVKHPRPGPYRMRYEVTYMEPLGTWRMLMSGASGYDVIAPIAKDPARPK